MAIAKKSDAGGNNSKSGIVARSAPAYAPMPTFGSIGFTGVKKPVVKKPVVAKPASKPSYSPAAVTRKISTPAPKAAVKPVAKKAAPAPVVKKVVPVAKVAPKPQPTPAKYVPTLEEFLAGDTSYMQQEADLRRAGDQFGIQQGTARTQYGQDFILNKSNLDKAYADANTSMTDDYASRGMLNSGAYATAYGDQKTEYDSRQAAMNQAQTQWNTSQANDQTNFTEEQTLSAQRAKDAAIARRAATLGQ